jgi:hypothetical protein
VSGLMPGMLLPQLPPPRPSESSAPRDILERQRTRNPFLLDFESLERKASRASCHSSPSRDLRPHLRRRRPSRTSSPPPNPSLTSANAYYVLRGRCHYGLIGDERGERVTQPACGRAILFGDSVYFRCYSGTASRAGRCFHDNSGGFRTVVCVVGVPVLGQSACAAPD